MPVSKRRKPKKALQRSAGRPGGRNSYRPGRLPEAALPTLDRIMMLTPRVLPAAALAEWYLGSTPVRDMNQCAFATLAVQVAAVHLGLAADPVALTLEVPKPGGVTLYGNESPHIVGDQLVGHIGIIVDGIFLDITGTQFPEMRSHGGVRVITGDLQGNEDAILNSGAVIPLRLADGHWVTYRILPAGTAEPVLATTLERNKEALTLITRNLLLGFTAAMAQPPLSSRLDELDQARYSTFIAAVQSMRHKRITMDDDGRFQVETPLG